MQTTKINLALIGALILVVLANEKIVHAQFIPQPFGPAFQSFQSFPQLQSIPSFQQFPPFQQPPPFLGSFSWPAPNGMNAIFPTGLGTSLGPPFLSPLGNLGPQPDLGLFQKLSQEMGKSNNRFSLDNLPGTKGLATSR